jgi:tetratricopeptide (TPR) repeat protein
MDNQSVVRSVRLFLSSTFLDMQDEREELIRKIFPELREFCEARGVNWGEVDLRWGVTRGEAEEGLALPICLAEVDECRPFFLAILGERYGWVPDAIAPEVVDRYPWLAGLSGRSVTELEVRHGALNVGPTTPLFYFRDPTWLDRLPTTADQSKFESANPEAKRRLTELKAEITASGHPVRVYRDPKELGAFVREDMTRLLEERLPNAPPDTAASDIAAQRALINRLALSHYGREADIGRLDAHADGHHAPAGLVVTGVPGSGKTSVLAKWVKLREAPREPSRGLKARLWPRFMRRNRRRSEVIMFHFAGASIDSTGVPAILRRITLALARWAGFRPVISDDPIGLASCFVEALARASAQGKVILVLDGLDQIDQRSQGLDLAWLPDPLPAGVRLFASAGPGPVLDELTGRGWRTLELGLVDRPGRASFVASYLLHNHRKKLDSDQIARVTAIEPGANPLFLRTLLEELVASARGIEDLSALIDRFATATTTGDIFDLMLTRLEPEHGRDRPGLVAESLVLLWASRYGLTDREAAELLGPPGDLLPAAFWVPLRHALRPFTSTWSGLVGLPKGGLREAVERRYLSDPHTKFAAHRRLADYFANRPFSRRVVEERPWHLAAVGDWKALALLLANPSFLVAAWPVHRYELRAYWRAVEAETAIRMADVLAGLVNSPAPAALAAAQLLADFGWRVEAMRIAHRQATLRGSGGAVGLSVLDLAARLAMESGDLNAAHTFSVRQAAEAQSAGDVDAQVAALARLAAVGRRQGAVERERAGLGTDARALKYDQAVEAHLDEAERLAVSSGARDRLSDLLGQRGRWLADRGKPAEALVLCARRAEIYRQLGDLAGLQDTAAHRGQLLAALRKSSKALAAFDEAEALARRLHDPAALQSCLGDRANTLMARRRLDDALQAILERERICRDVLNDPCALALTTLQKAQLFGEVMKQTALGLDLVTQAEQFAEGADCAEAMARASAVRDAILVAGLRPT